MYLVKIGVTPRWKNLREISITETGNGSDWKYRVSLKKFITFAWVAFYEAE